MIIMILLLVISDLRDVEGWQEKQTDGSLKATRGEPPARSEWATKYCGCACPRAPRQTVSCACSTAATTSCSTAFASPPKGRRGRDVRVERCQPYDARGQQHAMGPHRDRVCGSVDFMTVTVKNLRLDDATCGAYVAAHAAVEPMPAFGFCDAFFWLFHRSLYYFAFHEHRSLYYFAVRAATLLLPGSFIVIIIFVLTQICILIS